MRTLSVALITATLVLSVPAVAVEPPQNFVVHNEPQAMSELPFKHSDGRPKSLGNFRGRVVLLNIWATWCVPCQEEMPTLNWLYEECVGGPVFEVVALSIDRAGIEVVREYFDEIAVEHLATYVDDTGKAFRKLGIFGLPTTLLIDRKRREIGRFIGAAEWDAPEIVDFIYSRIETE